MHSRRDLSRRKVLQTAAAASAAAVLSRGCSSPPTGAGDQPATPERKDPVFDVADHRQLFIDRHLVADARDVTCVVNPPQCRELVLIAEKPWESGGITCYATAFWDEMHRQFRMYYVPVSFAPDSGLTYRLALATSSDGIHWEKPTLAAVEFRGSRDNNIVIDNQREGSVFVDPNAPAQRRYGYLSGDEKSGICYFSSPDGIRFTRDPSPISSYWSDSQTCTFWDADRKKYVSYPRAAYIGGGKWRLLEHVTFSDNIVPATAAADFQRTVARIETDRPDEPWPTPLSLHVVMAPDDQDPPGVDLYTNAATKYALAPNVDLAFPTPYYHYNHRGREYLNAPALANGGKTNDGVIDTQLATSRDGITWTRYRTPYVPLHRYEELDLKLCQVFPGLLYHSDRIDHYFAGYAFTHGDRKARERLTGRALGGVFRLSQRIDGFTSMDFSYTGGVLETRPVTFRGRSLFLNVNTSAAGEARVALLNLGGKALEGFAADDCRIINGDFLEKRVEWSAGHDLSRWAGQPVRLRFEMRGAKLFSFRFGDQPTVNS